MTPRLLTPKQAADYLGVPASTLASWRYLDRGDGGSRGPKHLAPNGKAYRYSLDALDEWLRGEAA